MFSSYIFLPSSPPLFSWVLLQFRMLSMECLHPSRRIVRDVSSIEYTLFICLKLTMKREGVPRTGRATARYVKRRGPHLHFPRYQVHCLRLRVTWHTASWSYLSLNKKWWHFENRVTATWSHMEKSVSHIFEGLLLWLLKSNHHHFSVAMVLNSTNIRINS